MVRLDVAAWLLALLALLGASAAPDRGIAETYRLLVAGPTTGDGGILPSAGSGIDQRLPQFEQRHRLDRAAPAPSDGPWGTAGTAAALPGGTAPASPATAREADPRPAAAAAFDARAPPRAA